MFIKSNELKEIKIQQISKIKLNKSNKEKGKQDTELATQWSLINDGINKKDRNKRKTQLGIHHV